MIGKYTDVKIVYRMMADGCTYIIHHLGCFNRIIIIGLSNLTCVTTETMVIISLKRPLLVKIFYVAYRHSIVAIVSHPFHDFIILNVVSDCRLFSNLRWITIRISILNP